MTEADRAAEATMRQMINRTFPSHGIIGEEFGDERKDAEFVWVLDPIDGTKAFISGLPMWGTLIGLMRNGAPCLRPHAPAFHERALLWRRRLRWRGPSGERELRTRRANP